ncbi:MAG: RNB domain-containing ribonuclease [Candidatus Lindowbacteria bacterium]|nr:RNB domain-containing ribonuclease [Candidatus Lindowbacteria bacterium]
MSEFLGKVIEYQEKDKFRFAFVTGGGASKLQGVDSNGRQIALSSKKIMVLHDSYSGDRSGLSEFATSAEDQIRTYSEDFDTELLWSTVGDNQDTLSARELAVLYFGEANSFHESTVMRTLSSDPVYFKRDGNRFQAREKELVEKIKLKKRREKENAERDAAELEWLKFVMESPATVSPEGHDELVQLVEDFLRREERNRATTLLPRVSDSEPSRETAFEILKKLGILAEDASFLLVTNDIQEVFSEEALSVAQEIEAYKGDSSRFVVAGCETIAIDDEETREVDDAISIQQIPEGWRVGIHITDVSSFFTKDNILDKEALHRSTTLYLPTGFIPMLPDAVSSGVATLTTGGERPVISTFVKFDEEGTILGSEIKRSEITLTRRMTYKAVDELLNSADVPMTWQALEKITRKLTSDRLADGAVVFERIEMKVRVKGEEIQVTAIENDSRSRKIVSEMMILANTVTAEFADVNEIPVIFRVQDPPSVPSGKVIDAPEDIVKFMKPARLSQIAQPHSGLGLKSYLQSTSPIRRYGDLVLQRQITAFLSGMDFEYKSQELFEVLAAAEDSEKRAKSVERELTRYWLIKYMDKYHREDVLDAQVLRKNTRGYQVQLEEYGLRGGVRTQEYFDEGTILKVKVDEVNAEKSILNFVIIQD